VRKKGYRKIVRGGRGASRNVMTNSAWRWSVNSWLLLLVGDLYAAPGGFFFPRSGEFGARDSTGRAGLPREFEGGGGPSLFGELCGIAVLGCLSSANALRRHARSEATKQSISVIPDGARARRPGISRFQFDARIAPDDSGGPPPCSLYTSRRPRARVPYHIARTRWRAGRTRFNRRQKIPLLKLLCGGFVVSERRFSMASFHCLGATMTTTAIPQGFERQSLPSPLTLSWEPIYSRKTPETIVLGLG